MEPFRDRRDAALQLAAALEKYKDQHALVLGIARGGVETAYYLARELHGDLSLLVCRKLGHTANPEYALGAMAEDGSVYLRTTALAEASRKELDRVVRSQQKETERRIRILRKGKPLPPMTGRTVILADDGIATGATVMAAIYMCRKQGAAIIVVAAPVAAPDVVEALNLLADEVVILHQPDNLFAVSQAYTSFANLTDAEVLSFLEKWEKNPVSSAGKG